MNALRPFFYKFPQNVAVCFKGRNVLWHALAIALTVLSVFSGFDWWYYQHSRDGVLFYLFIPAAIIGFLVPVLTPIVLLVLGKSRSDVRLLNAAYALAQSAALALLLSFAYKAVTGRAHPTLFGQTSTVDISRVFHFGAFDGGIFWGWPSSHTMVACAVAATALVLYPRSRRVRIAAFVFAVYVGVGVSLTIHWFSDFVAGAILGTLVGVIVGRTFRNRLVVP